MISINEQLKARLSSNNKILTETKNSLKKLRIDGELYICHDKGRTNYYRIDDANNRTYISKKNTKLLKQLANKKYYRKVISLIDKENAWINKTLRACPAQTYEQLYADNPDMRALINPIYKTDKEMMEHWDAMRYESNPFMPEKKIHKTNRGEYVRSKSEKIIADKLFELGIPYKYEYPIMVNGKIRYVDFFILSITLRKAFMLEHFGMMGDPAYVKDAVEKIHEYEKAGIRMGDKLIATFEYDNESIDMEVFTSMICECLQI